VVTNLAAQLLWCCQVDAHRRHASTMRVNLEAPKKLRGQIGHH